VVNLKLELSTRAGRVRFRSDAKTCEMGGVGMSRAKPKVLILDKCESLSM
jgi:hypothetical protein